ncbi:MAG: putative Transcriptional regulator [Promethearchaeota archaeon]|nr:MAG: putative Transcriptional regulator [Candidatus Lokiarchaeota archaeon]
MDLNEKIIEKSKLNDIELEEFYKRSEKIQGHSLAFRTMMSSTRRKILQYIGEEIKSTEEICENFNMDETQIKYHLSMLEQALYIIESPLGWKATPSGIGFILNTKL